ncbi:MAG: HEAT repeat domain-containing protein [Candidatus Wallbacteria bacterium]|nr:HEAT repeat domain-containing protein [Candidatus Wallbacteria bacterium]
MNKNQALIIVLIIAAVAAIYSYSTFQRAKPLPVAQQAGPTIKSAGPAPRVTQPATQPSPAETTELYAQVDQILDQAEPVAGTKEADISKGQWAREYLKKYQGKIPDELLDKLNKLMAAADQGDYNAYLALIHELINQRGKITDILEEIANDKTISDVFKLPLAELMAETGSKAATSVLVNLTNKILPQAVRNEAITALSMGNYSPEVKEKALITIARDPEENVNNRAMALTYIGQFQKEEHRTMLIGMVKEPELDEKVKIAAAYALQAYTQYTAETAAVLKEIVEDKNCGGMLRGVAMKSLTQVAHDEARDNLIKLIKQQDHPTARANAMSSARNYPDHEVTMALLDVLLDEREDFTLRSAASRAIANRSKDQEVINMLIDKFQELDGWGAVCAAKFIFSKQKATESLPALRKRLNDRGKIRSRGHSDESSGATKFVLSSIKLIEEVDNE